MNAGMPVLPRALETIKDLEGVHILQYRKEAATDLVEGAPGKRPFHQLNNVSYILQTFLTHHTPS